LEENMTRQPDGDQKPERSQPRQRNAAATRSRLMEAARQQFLQHGYQGASLRSIAAQAGVDVMLIRRYIGSKQQLFTEATDISDNVPAARRAHEHAVGQLLIERVLHARRDIDAPLFALLRSSGDPAVVARLNQQIETGLTRNLSGRITTDQPRLRADMVTALLLGIGVLRVLLNKDPIATATDRDIATVFDEAFHSLTKLPQGTNESAGS
jgi:AcrR family transcriptional regulator